MTLEFKASSNSLKLNSNDFHIAGVNQRPVYMNFIQTNANIT